MNNTIITNEVEDTRGKNLNSIDDDLADIKNDTGDLEVSDNNDDISITISDEEYERLSNRIDNMNFIEVSKFKKEILEQISAIKYAKETAESISNINKEIENPMTDNNSLAEAIMVADAESTAGTDDLEEFLKSYEDISEKMNKLLEKAEEAIHTFDNTKKTTTFLTSAMLQIIESNLNRLSKEQEAGKNVKHTIAYYKELERMYKNRTDISFIDEKLDAKEVLLKRLKTSIKKDKSGSVVKNVQKNVTKSFCKIFSVSQLSMFEANINKIFKNSDSSFYFQYALHLIYTSEKESGKCGKHKWIEILIMNVLDIATDMYDLDGGKELYYDQLLILRDHINTILHIK